MNERRRYLSVCRQPFTELEGDDPLQRRCWRCVSVVHNFDALTLEQRDALLERADRQRTMCVGTSPPVAAAPPCDPPPLEDEERAFARALAVREMVEPAPTWRHALAQPLPAVVDAIRELAGDYGLRESSYAGTVRWHLDDRDRAASFMVTAQPRDQRTELVVRVLPLPRPGAAAWLAHRLNPGVVTVTLLALFFLAFHVISRIHPPAVLLLQPLIVVLAAAAVAVLHLIDVAGRRRHAAALRAWGETWQHGFHTALAARLAPPHLYRR